MKQYYEDDKSLSPRKRMDITRCMEAVISVTKSNMGKVVRIENMFEKRNLIKRVDELQAERRHNIVFLNNRKLLFNARYGKWVDNRERLMPEKLQTIKKKYQLIKENLRKVENENKKKAGPPQVEKPQTRSRRTIHDLEMEQFFPAIEKKPPPKPVSAKPQRIYHYRCHTDLPISDVAPVKDAFPERHLEDFLQFNKLHQEELIFNKALDRWDSMILHRRDTFDYRRSCGRWCAKASQKSQAKSQPAMSRTLSVMTSRF